MRDKHSGLLNYVDYVAPYYVGTGVSKRVEDSPDWVVLSHKIPRKEFSQPYQIKRIA